MTLYTTLLRRSWTITKKHKILWVFGFFVLFMGGRGLDMELFFTQAKLFREGASPLSPSFWQWEHWQPVIASVDSSFLFGVFLAALSVLFLVVCVGIVMSQIGLVHAFSTESTEKYSLTKALASGEQFLPRVFLVNVIAKGVTVALLALVSSPLFLSKFIDMPFLYSFLLFLVVAPISVVISLIMKYAVNYVVIENTSVRESLVLAWKLFKENVGVSLEYAVLLFVAYFGCNVIALILALIATLPVLFFANVLYVALGTIAGIFIYYFFLYAAVVISFVMTATIFSVWHYGSWTLLFLELTKEKKRSKIHRLLKGE